MPGGLSGRTVSETTIPQYIEDAARRNLARADELAMIGYVPYFGPEVAAFSPMEEAAFQGTNMAASAFGMPTGAVSMPTPETYAGGVRGYSSAPMYEAARAQLAARFPGQYAALTAPFINPVTGERPAFPFGLTSPPMGYGDMYGGANVGAPMIRESGADLGEQILRPRGALGEPIITSAYPTFGQDLRASLFDPTYDPPGTVFTRALGIPPRETQRDERPQPVQAPPPRPASVSSGGSRPASSGPARSNTSGGGSSSRSGGGTSRDRGR